MPTEAKVEKVAKIKDYLEKADSFFVAEYLGLKVSEMTELRAKLRDSDSRLVVEKNTLIRVAAREAGIEGLAEHLTGPTAITFAFGDPVAPAKALYESFKKHDLPVVRAFSISGEMMDGSRIKELADLPSRDELLAQVIGNIEAPIAELVSSLDAVVQEFVGTVEALAEAGGAKAA